MKISCLRTALTAAVSNASRAVSAKSAIPALEGVLIKAQGEKLNISGYNLEIGITSDIDATIQQPGEVVVSARLFLDIVRRLPEEIVTIETDERLITYIICGKAEFQIVGMPSIEYPDLPTFEKTNSFKIDVKTLREMIRQTVYAVSDNESKPVYMGSLYELTNGMLRIVAIDGFRMAIRSETVDCDSVTDFIVPGKTQNEVLKLLTDDDEQAEIIIGQRHITYCVKNYKVISRLIEGTFLDYKTTIPNEFKTELVINTRKLIDSVERMSLLDNERVKSPVRCKLSNDEIKLSCASAVGRANDEISVTIAGEPLEIGFNNRYMLDALRNADADEVRIKFNSPVSPIVIEPVEGDSFLYIVVPVRISNEI